MGIEDTLALPVWERVCLLEIEPGKRLDGYAWTQDATYTDCWYRPWSDWTPSRVEEDGDDLTEQSSLSDCNTNPGSFYWDDTNERVYVHTTGSDNPQGYFIVVFLWEYFTNMQFEDEPVIYNGRYYLPYLHSDDMPDISQTTSEYYEGGVRYGFGSVKLLNDGFWDTRLSELVWENKKILLKIGKKGDNYADFATFWVGWTGEILWSDEVVEIAIEDFRS